MAIKVLDGNDLARMVIQGANHLAANAKVVDALNVFPVPDGDTGTNMNLSITSGAKEVKNNLQDHIGNVGKALSKGLLMGARGNSGVILSQLFRGFAKAIEHHATINSKDLAHAFQQGVDTAYKAVMKPVEGTILTVAKDAASRAVSVAEKESDIIIVLEELVKEAAASLERTPDLLPVLKEVGVVDSGGKGLLFIYEGFLAEVKGEKLPEVITPSMDELVSAEHHKSVQEFMSTDEIEFGYCTEFMVKFEQDKLEKHPFSEEAFRSDLSKYGDSLLVISDEEIAKVHIHSEQPGKVLTYGQQYGSLINMKIENMRQQHAAIVDSPNKAINNPTKIQKQQEFGIVVVSMGSGIAKLFKSIGADVVIEGGQTMNPSTEDIVKAVEEVHANKIIILPNNKNIIMAAEQAVEVMEKEVIVIPTKTVPQGMSALLAFNPTQDLMENKNTMIEAIQHVKTGQITYAIRDTSINGLSIKKDDFMGIADGEIIVQAKDVHTAAINLLEKMIDEDAEILTVLTGKDINEADTNKLTNEIEARFEVEVEVHQGDQPLYPFIFAIE